MLHRFLLLMLFFPLANFAQQSFDDQRPVALEVENETIQKIKNAFNEKFAVTVAATAC